MQGTAVK